MTDVKALNDGEFRGFVDENDVAFVDFYADWCGPCKMVEPAIEELSKEMDGKVAFARIDVDKDKERATEFGIMSIPTFLIFKGGKLVDRLIGAVPKEAIKERLEKFLE